MADSAADHAALTEAALLAQTEAAQAEGRMAARTGSPVPAAAPGPAPAGEVVLHEDLAAWILSELTPKLVAIGERLDAIELTLRDFDQRIAERYDNTSAVQAEWADTFNRAQAQHGETHDALQAKLDSTETRFEEVQRDLDSLGERVDSLAQAQLTAPPPQASEGGA